MPFNQIKIDVDIRGLLPSLNLNCIHRCLRSVTLFFFGKLDDADGLHRAPPSAVVGLPPSVSSRFGSKLPNLC